MPVDKNQIDFVKRVQLIFNCILQQGTLPYIRDSPYGKIVVAARMMVTTRP